MNIVLDVSCGKELKENDVIVFKNGKWQVISKEMFFANCDKKQFELARKIAKMEKDIVSLAKIVKEK